MQVFHALPGDFIGRRLVFEHLHRDPALIGNLVQGQGRGGVVDFTHPRTEEVGIVGVVMSDPGGIIADKVPQALFLGAHGLDVEVELEVRVIDNIEEVRRDLNYARTEVETYRQQNRSLRDRIGALEERLANMQRLMELREQIAQAEYEQRLGLASTSSQASPATAADPEPEPPAEAGSDSVVEEDEPSVVAAVSPSASAASNTAPTQQPGAVSLPAQSPPQTQTLARRSGFGSWFPYLGGLMVAILAGILFYMRARAEEQRGRDFYRALENTATRSYLPGQV